LRVVCRYCGYAWDYNGIGLYATCPRCYRKTKVEEIERILREIIMKRK